MPRPRKLTDEQIDEIIKLRKEGKSLPYLARLYGIHHSTIIYNLRNYSDIKPIIKEKSVSKKYIKSIKFLPDPKYSYMEIMRKSLNVSLGNTLKDRLKRELNERKLRKIKRNFNFNAYN